MPSEKPSLPWLCEQCGGTFLAPYDHYGQPIECPNCNQVTKVLKQAAVTRGSLPAKQSPLALVLGALIIGFIVLALAVWFISQDAAKKRDKERAIQEAQAKQMEIAKAAEAASKERWEQKIAPVAQGASNEKLTGNSTGKEWNSASSEAKRGFCRLAAQIANDKSRQVGARFTPEFFYERLDYECWTKARWNATLADLAGEVTTEALKKFLAEQDAVRTRALREQEVIRTRTTADWTPLLMGKSKQEVKSILGPPDSAHYINDFEEWKYSQRGYNSTTEKYDGMRIKFNGGICTAVGFGW